MHWSPAIGAEHLATRERAGLFDESSFAKLEVTGPGAAEFLERLCDNRVARDVGAITYTQMLNRRGGIECDFTVTRVEEELFSIVTGTAFGNHDLSWIRRHAPADGSVRCADVTARWACFALWGPRARRDPRAADARRARLPLHVDARARRSATCRCGRCASRSSASSAGSSTARPSTAPGCGGRCGRRAASTASSPAATARSTRCASRRATASGPRTSPRTRRRYEAGLGFCVKRRADGFIGSEALGRTATAIAGAGARLRCVLLEDPRSVALGNEPVRVDGEVRGRVTSGGYGYTVERSIAYAYLPAEIGDRRPRVEIDIFGRWIGGEIAREPLFDPRGERVRAAVGDAASPA